MQINSFVEKHQVNFSHTFIYRLYFAKRSVTLSDQEEACTSPYNAYLFARLKISGTDIKKCQENACKDPQWAYHFAANIPGADIAYCRKACERDDVLLSRFDKMLIKKAKTKRI